MQMLQFHPMRPVYGPNAIQAVVKFPNGFEVSVIRHCGSYGNKRGEGFYEAGIFLTHTSKRWNRICPVVMGRIPYFLQNEVKGWLTLPQCELIAQRVRKLPNFATLLRKAKKREKQLRRIQRRQHIRSLLAA